MGVESAADAAYTHAKSCPQTTLTSTKPPKQHQNAPQPRTIVVAVDDSPHSSHALDWVAAHLANGRDEFHVVCVALPCPYPVSPVSSV